MIVHERLDRWRRSRWANLFIVNLRILLGFAFLPAGLKKVLDEPFTDPAKTGTFHQFLDAFYATGFFYQFVGAVQLAIAALLLTQTLATLGALMALPVFATIYRPVGVELRNPAFYLLPLIALLPVVTFAVEQRRRSRKTR